MNDDDGLKEATRRFIEKTGGLFANEYVTPSGHHISNIVAADYHAPLGLLPDVPHYILAKRVLFGSQFNDESGGRGVSVPLHMLEQAAKGNGIVVHYHHKEFYEMSAREWLNKGRYRAEGYPDPDVGLPFSRLKKMFGEIPA